MARSVEEILAQADELATRFEHFDPPADQVPGAPAPEEVAVAALVDGGRILLVHRRPGRASYPDCWDLPGGHLEPGESPEDAVRRECHEELGITPDGVRPIDLAGSDPTLVKHAFAVVSWQGAPTNMAPEEHDGLAWFTADELDALTLADRADLPVLVEILD